MPVRDKEVREGREETSSQILDPLTKWEGHRLVSMERERRVWRALKGFRIALLLLHGPFEELRRWITSVWRWDNWRRSLQRGATPEG